MKIEGIVEFADKIAEKYHKGQYRNWTGDDFIIHPRTCAKLAETRYKPTVNYHTGLPKGEELPLLKCACLLHDMEEDCGVSYTELCQLFDAAYESRITRPMLMAVDMLNKHNYANYSLYIQGVKHDMIATFVKLCDIEHNLCDLKPGDLRDKYELAEYILTH